jgi:general secretion pathway protein C
MPLVLAGVIAVADPQKGMAIVGPNAGSARLVSVGGTIDGGVKLHSVYGDRVLLDRGGAIEALFLPKTLGPALAVTPPAASPGQRLQALSQNSMLLNGLARVQAVFTAGKLSGYRVFPAGRNSIVAFTQLGLMPGDLITAINGTALDDPNRASEVLQTLSNAGSANVTVSRNGKMQEVGLNLETVATAAEAAAAADAAANSESPGPAFATGRPGIRNRNGARPDGASRSPAEQ